MLTPPKKSHATTLNQSTTAKSNYINSPEYRSTKFSNVKEIPLDPNSRYTISLVPGMSEHEIDTGKTFEDAKMKIVLLTTELEKTQSYNYTLVRENEVLRVQANKSEREKDLETKLAIVLAENEKLNQIIEEVYEVYMNSRGSFGPGDVNEKYEQRINELYQNLDEWKEKYSLLENQSNIVELQNALQEANNDRELLTEKLARNERDLEALRARLAALDSGNNSRRNSGDDLAQKNAILTAENKSLNNELEAMKLQYGNANQLQLRLSNYEEKIKAILIENERLNESVQRMIGDVKELKKVQEENKRLNTRISDLERDLAAAGRNSNASIELLSLKSQVQDLLRENERLNTLLLKRSSHSHVEESPYQKEEIKRLQNQLEEKQREIDGLYVKLSESYKNSTMVDQYNDKILILAQENERLNNLLQSKLGGDESLKTRISTLEAQKYTDEDRIRTLTADNQRLRDLANEAETLRYKLLEVQSNSGQVNELLSKITFISTENERLNSELNTLKAKLRDSDSDRFKFELIMSEKDREIENLKSNNVRVVETEINHLNRENEGLKNAGVEQKRKIGELEGRLLQLVALETKVNYFNIEIEKLNQNGRDREAHIQALSKMLEDKERELSDLKRQSYSRESEIEYKISSLESAKRAAEDKANSYKTEIDRYQTMLREIKKELEEWKVRYTQLEDSRANEEELDELRRQFESLQKINIQIKDFQQKFAAERTAYETQILQLEERVDDLVHENNLLKQENEKLNTVNAQRLSMIQELKVNRNEENYKLEIHQLRNQIELLKSQSYDVKQLAIQHSSERAIDQARIEELSHNNATLKQELLKLRELLELRKADVLSLTQQNEDLMRISQKLQGENFGRNSNASFETIESLRSKVSDLELSRNEYKRQAERNAIDLTRKNRELVDKIQEVDVLKLKYEEALANYQALNSQLFSRLSVR